MKLRKIIAGAAAAVIAVSALAVSASAATAAITFQTNVYTFRNHMFQSKAVYWDEFNEAHDCDPTEFTDADISQNGTYTVKGTFGVEDTSLGATESTLWKFLILATDCSINDYPDLTLTVTSLKIDGVEKDITTAAQGLRDLAGNDQYVDEGLTGVNVTDSVVVQFYNAYDSLAVIKDSDFGHEIEVTFVVNGMEGDPVEIPAVTAPAAVEATEAETEAATEAETTIAEETAAVTEETTVAAETTLAAEEAPATGLPTWAIVCIAVGGVLIVAVVVFVIVKKKK